MPDPQLPEWEVEVGYIAGPDGGTLTVEVGDWSTTIDTRDPRRRQHIHTITKIYSFTEPPVVVRGDGVLTSLYVREAPDAP